MARLVGREVLNGLIHPKFQAELPDRVAKQVARKVSETKKEGDYGWITLGELAKDVREAAKRLKTKPRVPKKLLEVLPEIARLPGY